MTATTLNPSDKSANATLSNGNLTVTTTPSAFSSVRSTVAKSTGKVYFEVKVDAVGGISAFAMGIANATTTLATIPGGTAGTLDSVGYYQAATSTYYSGSNVSKSMGSIVAATYVGVAIDFTNKNVFFVGPSGVWDGVAGDDPVTNTGGMNGPTFYGPTTSFGSSMTTLLGTSMYAMLSVYNNSQLTVNFGASAFHYTVPTGFTAWDSGATETSTAVMTFAGLSFSGTANDIHAAGSMAFTKASFSGTAVRVETSTAAMAFAGLTFTGHTNDDHVTGGMAFSGINFNTSVNVHSAAGRMTFAGISLGGSTHEVATTTGRMTFAGIGINGVATRIETGAGALHFAGISMSGLVTRLESASGLMNFAGIGIRGSVFDYPPAGFGRRSSWTFGA